MSEICICAAWRTEEGVVVRGHRHPHCLTTALSMGLHPLRGQDAQGFVTSTGRFVGRQEAARLHTAATGAKVGEVLFSEDLY